MRADRDPAASKGIVKREVIQIVTPGTVLSSSMLRENENNYIASVFAGDDTLGLSYCDVSTGEIYLTSISGGAGMKENFVNELVRINASELILDENSAEAIDVESIRPVTGAYINTLDGSYYGTDASRDVIKRQFDVSAVFGIGVEGLAGRSGAPERCCSICTKLKKNALGHIAYLNVYSMGQRMSLDKSTIKNLELTETLFEKKLKGSLLGVLDRTHTAMGSRKLRQWIKEPLNDVARISARLDAVDSLLDNILVRNNITDALKRVYDFERLTGRIACGTANGKDLIALRNSCHVLPDIKDELMSTDSALLFELESRIHTLKQVHDTIDIGIVEDPPFSVKEGGLIKEGYSQELDELKSSIKDAQDWIAGLEASERERTGIRTSRSGSTKVFGYYLEVTRSYYDMVLTTISKNRRLPTAGVSSLELKETRGAWC